MCIPLHDNMADITITMSGMLNVAFSVYKLQSAFECLVDNLDVDIMY